MIIEWDEEKSYEVKLYADMEFKIRDGETGGFEFQYGGFKYSAVNGRVRIIPLEMEDTEPITPVKLLINGWTQQESTPALKSRWEFFQNEGYVICHNERSKWTLYKREPFGNKFLMTGIETFGDMKHGFD